MNRPHDKRIFRLAPLGVLALLMFGCFGGSNSPSSDPDGANSANGDITETVVQDGSGSAPDPADNSDPDTVVADPVVQDRVQVSFDITVPAYQSNQLRVEVEWGNINLVAAWLGDEYWSATGEFPLNTHHSVSVTFYDWNGGIELARFTDPVDHRIY